MRECVSYDTVCKKTEENPLSYFVETEERGLLHNNRLMTNLFDTSMKRLTVVGVLCNYALTNSDLPSHLLTDLR